MPYKGGKRDRAQLSYDRDLYYYSTLKIAQPLTEAEAKKEYSRLRSIARKRLERFKGTEWTETQTYKYNAGQFPQVKDIKDTDELYRRLSTVATFVSSSRGSVAGLKRERKRNIETLHSHGYNFVDVKNYRKFADFMEYTKAGKMSQIYDSKRIAELFRTAEKKKIPKDELFKDFSAWMDNADKLDKMEEITNDKRKVTANDYRKALGVKRPKKSNRR